METTFEDCMNDLQEAQTFIINLSKEKNKTQIGFQLGLLATHLKDLEYKLKECLINNKLTDIQ